MILLYGPTGAGKSDLALTLSVYLPIEIINMDVGQFYTPLTIGTAKPDWSSNAVPHHFFDILDRPIHFTAFEYRRRLLPLIEAIRNRGNVPVVVGGSGFYVKSLLFPLCSFETHMQSNVAEKIPDEKATMPLWDQLYAIDAERAKSIQLNDTYRLARALDLWRSTGIRPSTYKPTYANDLGDCHLIWIDRTREDLYARINSRVPIMFERGWIHEVKNLDKDWIAFILQKKIIGYNEIATFMQAPSSFQDSEHYDTLVAVIAQRTRHYARRQILFWRTLERELHDARRQEPSSIPLSITTINATLHDPTLAIKKLCDTWPLDQKGYSL
jgi:tRNA dimethylallyltransferase